MNKWVWALVAVAGAIAWHLLLPPQSVTLSTSSTDEAPIRGAIHVHTRRSDGTGTVDDVAAAARRAGLQFVIFTDHGDGTRGSDTPVYRYGVLCIDAVEISTNGGHVVALGLPQSEFPLAGELADVLEDVRRMGAMSIAAHPDSPRAELRLNDWNAAFDGIEWLNGDSQWRDEGWGTLGRALFTYPFRRAATLVTLLDRPDDLLNRWDTMIRERSVVTVAAADAHARVGPGGDPYGRSLSVHLPSYEQVFRALSISLPRVQLHGNAAEDAGVVLDAIRNGRVFSTIDALASPATFTFTATSGAHQAVMGERLSLDGPVTAARRDQWSRWFDHQVAVGRKGSRIGRTASSGIHGAVEASCVSRRDREPRRARFARRFHGFCRIRSTSGAKHLPRRRHEPLRSHRQLLCTQTVRLLTGVSRRACDPKARSVSRRASTARSCSCAMGWVERCRSRHT